MTTFARDACRAMVYCLVVVAAITCLPCCAAANISVALKCYAPCATFPITIDGKLDEWRRAQRVLLLGDAHWCAAREGETYGGLSDLAARFYVSWDESNLYIAVEAYDNDLVPPAQVEEMLQGDCIVVAVDANNDASEGYRDDDSEFGFAYTPGGPVAWRWFPSERAGVLEAAKVAVVRELKPGALEAGMPPVKLTCEVSLPWSELPGGARQAGAALGFDLVVNDVDHDGRHGWLEWTPGIMGIKDPSQFGNVLLMPIGAPQSTPLETQ